MTYLGAGTTHDVSSYSGYKNFTANNFIIELVSATATPSASKGSTANSWISWPSAFDVTTTIIKNYNADTGILSISGNTKSDSRTSAWNDTGTHNTLAAKVSTSFNVYLIW